MQIIATVSMPRQRTETADKIVMTANQIITFTLNRRALLTIHEDAVRCSLGGSSQVRGSDRADKLLEDQMCGLIGNYALSLWRDGDDRSYRDARHSQNQFASKGDGGYDLPRVRFDVKTSMMRGSNEPLRYNLAVRPRERHAGWVYGLALIERFSMESLKSNPQVTVHLVGWATDDELPEKPNGAGVFSGAYTLPVMSLHPFTPLIYEHTAHATYQTPIRSQNPPLQKTGTF